MTKFCFLFILSLFFSKVAIAQKDTAVYYLTASGGLVHSKDSSDFFVKIAPPSPKDNPKLYVVNGYYNSGKPLFSATSLTSALPLKLQGAYTTYFNNGNKMSVRNFDNGEIVGESVLYYPNGKFYDRIDKEINVLDTTIAYKDCSDSTGKVLTVNGNGDWITYSDDFSTIVEKGKVHNFVRDSVWNITPLRGGPYNIVYDKGKLITDVTKIFTSVDIVPEFPGGLDAFGKFLSVNVKYPRQARESNIQGRVLVQFIVERDGSLTDIHVVKGIGGGCDEESMRVLKLSPKWKPGMQNGQAVRVQYSVPISFTLSTDD